MYKCTYWEKKLQQREWGTWYEIRQTMEDLKGHDTEFHLYPWSTTKGKYTRQWQYAWRFAFRKIDLALSKHSGVSVALGKLASHLMEDSPESLDARDFAKSTTDLIAFKKGALSSLSLSLPSLAITLSRLPFLFYFTGFSCHRLGTFALVRERSVIKPKKGLSIYENSAVRVSSRECFHWK